MVEQCNQGDLASKRALAGDLPEGITMPGLELRSKGNNNQSNRTYRTTPTGKFWAEGEDSEGETKGDHNEPDKREAPNKPCKGKKKQVSCQEE